MAVVYNGYHSNQSTVECDISNMADDDVNKMGDARARQQEQQTPRDVLCHATTVDCDTI
jgi:hypothetical protein